MPGKNKTRLLGWHPKSDELAERARAAAQRRGVPLARILDEALEAYLQGIESPGPDAPPGPS